MKTRTKNRSCEGKRPYATKREAKQAALTRLGRYHWYRCDFCKFWHIGHKPRPRRAR